MPDAIVVNGIPYNVYTDFRTWMKVGVLLDGFSVAKDRESLFYEICDLVVKEYPKKDIDANDFLESIVAFYSGYPKAENDTVKRRREQNKKSPKPPSFDFVYDASYIYCSFASFYHIRLWEIEYMHWWEFLVLFEGLMMSEATSVNYVVGARQAKIRSNMPKEEKKRIEKMQKEFALPKSEKEQTMESNLVNSLKSLSRRGKDKGEPNGKESDDMPADERNQ